METQARTTQRKLCKFVTISQFTQFTIGQKVLSVDSHAIKHVKSAMFEFEPVS